jgi:hypothetical protein
VEPNTSAKYFVYSENAKNLFRLHPNANKENKSLFFLKEEYPNNLKIFCEPYLSLDLSMHSVKVTIHFVTQSL